MFFSVLYTPGQREINSRITSIHLYLLICYCHYLFNLLLFVFSLRGNALVYLVELIVLGLHQMLRSKVFQLLVVQMGQVLAR